MLVTNYIYLDDSLPTLNELLLSSYILTAPVLKVRAILPKKD